MKLLLTCLLVMFSYSSTASLSIPAIVKVHPMKIDTSLYEQSSPWVIDTLNWDTILELATIIDIKDSNIRLTRKIDRLNDTNIDTGIDIVSDHLSRYSKYTVIWSNITYMLDRLDSEELSFTNKKLLLELLTTI